MNDIPTLPGTLPGLLQPGAPVIFAVEHITVRGWLVTRPAGWTDCGIGAEDLAMMDDGSDEVCAVHPSRLALDLSRPEGVDRALRWLAERLGIEGRPDWGRRFGTIGCWAIAEYGYGSVHTYFAPGHDMGELRGDEEIADLSDIPEGPHADAYALRLACLAVAEKSPA